MVLAGGRAYVEEGCELAGEVVERCAGEVDGKRVGRWSLGEGRERLRLSFGGFEMGGASMSYSLFLLFFSQVWVAPDAAAVFGLGETLSVGDRSSLSVEGCALRVAEQEGDGVSVAREEGDALSVGAGSGEALGSGFEGDAEGEAEGEAKGKAKAAGEAEAAWANRPRFAKPPDLGSLRVVEVVEGRDC
jgi:hypothetical protein